MAFSLLSALPPAAICPPGFFCWGDVPPGPGTSRETGPGGRGHASQGVGRGLLVAVPVAVPVAVDARLAPAAVRAHRDRKSTRLNSSHQIISYAVFCLKKKK